MTYIETKNKFHVALDGQGLLLQGAPNRPAYVQGQSPIYGNRFASGDRDYTDFSFWWFWAQTDWSGGYKLEDRWQDDAKFFNSEAVTVSTQPGDIGNVKLNWKQNNSIDSEGSDDRSFFAYGNPFNTFMIVGRNNTDEKMTAINVFNGNVIWEDSATGANEKILSAAEFGDGDMYIGCRTVGSGSSQLKKSTGSSFSDVGAINLGVGIYGLIAYKPTDRLYGFVWNAGIYEITKAGVATQKQSTFPLEETSAISFSFGIEGQSSSGLVLVGDRIYFTYQQSNTHRTQLWAYDIGDNAYVLIHTFSPGMFLRNPYLIERNGNIYIFGETGGAVYGRILIFKYDGSIMTQIHKVGRSDDATFSLKGGVVKDSESIYFGIDDGTSDYQIWQIDNADSIFSGIKPPATYSTDIDLLAISDVGNLAVVKNGTGTIVDEFDLIPINDYQTTGFIETSNFDAGIPSIDKLFHAITINFKKFASSQSIEVQYSTDGGSTYTSLGTASASVDGTDVTSKTFFFDGTTVSKTMKFKFILGGDGSNTPTLEAFAAQYVPIPIYTKQWTIQVNVADEVKRLDGRLVETTARELKSCLETSWWTKALLDFQDLDYATTLLNGSLTNSTTTINVDSTADFPEQGRLKVDDEEIFYTGKTPSSFTGCTRGVRDTIAVSHNDNAVINNAYKVLITDIQVRAPILLEDKQLEYIVQLTLREG